jgi:uncharacterized protein YbaR (Trm112 family)
MLERLTRLLVCPACHGSLDWDVSEKTKARIREGSASCGKCGMTYPVHREIGVFLTSLPKPDDLWEEANREIASFLENQPARVRRLMEAPLESLNPTDQLVRGLVHEERKEFGPAKIAIDLANEGMYAPEYRSAWTSQMRFVREQLTRGRGPVIDLASGMGSLLEFLLPDATEQFVGTDVSPRILMRDRTVLGSQGLGERLSLLAFDARRTPFADRSVPTLVTNAGLANIEAPGSLLAELRRVVADRLLAITVFYPEDEGANAEEIRRLKLDSLMYRGPAVQQLERAGFRVQVLNSQRAKAHPTPRGEIMSEVKPDRLPVVETEVEWCTLLAN